MRTEILDFAKNAKFKNTKSNSYQYFTINEVYQIRIYKNVKSYAFIHPAYSVTLHQISEDGITYDAYIRNEGASKLSEAKLIAAKYYFETIGI